MSSIATLIELSDLPFRPIDKENLTLNGVQTTQTELPRTVVTLEEPNKFLTLLRTSLVVVVENVSVLFMIDRAQISRGILDLKVDRIKIEASTSGMSGELLVLPEPLRLCAGQISFHQPHLTNGKIDWKLMPFKPIITVVGARLQASCKERHAGERSSNVTISEVVTMGIETKIGAESFAFNSSPTISVALFGVIQSLEPIWGDSSNSLNTEEKERIQLEKRNSFLEEKTKLQFQRDALLRIFNTIDVDDSCTLQEEELERAVLMLFAESSLAEGNESPISGTRQLTADELKRERDYLISIIDPAASNAVTFRDIDSVLFRMANKIDDNNLVPKIKATGVDYLDNFSHSDTFLSGPMLRKLVYFEDAREYSAMHEVYRITGHARLDKRSTFPVPSLWRQGQGIELFWEFYIRETGKFYFCIQCQ